MRVFYRRVAGEGTPTVYCHGNPTHGEDWLPFMERGGPAIAIDMPGWGRSDRPDPVRFDYSMYGLSAFLERCLDELGVERRKLVVHDWGALALIGAQRRPELVERAGGRSTPCRCCPATAGTGSPRSGAAVRWGEFFNATTTRSAVALLMRQAQRRPRPDAAGVRRHDLGALGHAGTGRAILALYRHADPDRLAAGRQRPRPPRLPSLVLWGERDPYLPTASPRPTPRRSRTPSWTSSRAPATGPGSTTPASIDRIVDFVA